MLNPDGVINGNYRTGLMGLDLNRQYADPDEEKVPVIYHLKELVNSHSHNLELFIDLHGHSRKCGYFLYGCSDNYMNPEQFSQTRLLSHILSHQSDTFDSSNCRWAMMKGTRRSTGRVVMRMEHDLIHSYTLEVSFLGSNSGAEPEHFNPTALVC